MLWSSKTITPQDCRDTRLEVPFGNNTVPAIKNRLKTLQPKGTTPIAKALESGALDFPGVTSNLEISLF